MGNALECLVAPSTQRRDEVAPVVRRDVGFTHSEARGEGHSKRIGLDANEGEGGERYNHIEVISVHTSPLCLNHHFSYYTVQLLSGPIIRLHRIHDM